jgi:beta-lactamase class C
MGHASRLNFGILVIAAVAFGAVAHAADDRDRSALQRIVDAAIRPVMTEHDVPGMAVAITVPEGRYIFNYGVASKAGARQVTDDTLFEIGSISKTFTGTLAGYAQARGTLSLSDTASHFLPALAGTSFDRISLLDLATYTAGGLPLQFPDDVTDHDRMIAYFRGWQPAWAAGTQRLYSNPSIGLFGHLVARGMDEPFDDLMEKQLFAMLGLSHTFIRIPQDRMADYAWGYTKDNQPIRVTPGVFASQAYGVKTTAADLIRFVEANIDGAGLDETLRRAIATARSGYDKVGNTIQGLGWEIYAYPTDLAQLLAGNSADMTLRPHEVTPFTPPLAPSQNELINKTGSTNGFGAYAAFLPARRIGVVLLANKNLPIPARVTAAYRILTALDGEAGAASAR